LSPANTDPIEEWMKTMIGMFVRLICNGEDKKLERERVNERWRGESE